MTKTIDNQPDLVLEAWQQFGQLLKALLGKRELSDTKCDVPPLLDVVCAAEAMAQLLQQTGRGLLLDKVR